MLALLGTTSATIVASSSVRMLSFIAVSGVMLPTVPDLDRKKEEKPAWKEVARHPPLSAGPACPAGAAQEEHLLLLRKATAAGLLLEHMYVLVCIGLFSMPFAADFGAGLERRRRGPQMDGEFAFYACHMQAHAHIAPVDPQ